MFEGVDTVILNNELAYQDLLPVAFWAGVAVIVVHLIWRAVRRRSGGGAP